MFALYVADHVDKIFMKLKKRDKARFEQINQKISEICENPFGYKPLRGDMHGAYRVHIGPYVLVFEIDEMTACVRIIDFAHHDDIY
jgi:addiction module RelE/StbE family toxin